MLSVQIYTKQSLLFDNNKLVIENPLYDLEIKYIVMCKVVYEYESRK